MAKQHGSVMSALFTFRGSSVIVLEVVMRMLSVLWMNAPTEDGVGVLTTRTGRFRSVNKHRIGEQFEESHSAGRLLCAGRHTNERAFMMELLLFLRFRINQHDMWNLVRKVFALGCRGALGSSLWTGE